MSGGGRRAGVNSGACIAAAVVFGTPTGRRRGGGGEGTGRRPGSIENIFEPLEQFFIFTPDRVRRGGIPVEKQDCGMDRWGWVVMNAYHVRCTRWGIRPRPKQERLLVEVIETFLVIQRGFLMVDFWISDFRLF
jgi:hypothetical protein